MSVSLDEYHAWTPGTKIELVDGQLVIGDSLSHSRRLLSQILRSWGIESLLALAPESLWWQALAYSFDQMGNQLEQLDPAILQQRAA